MSKDKSENKDLQLPPMSRRMRGFSMAMFFALGAALTWFVVGNPFGVGFLPNAHKGEPVAEHRHDQAPSGAVYQCPMHPEVVEDHATICPICQMDLVEVTEVSAAPTIYQCPMHPEVVQDTPGDCPICGMALVEVADPDGSRDGEIRIDPVQVQNIGVVSVMAERIDIARRSRTVGILDFNADDITWINVKFEGWIEKVHVNYVGESVKKGQPLFEIYGPELVTTQEEYLRALDYRESLEESGRPETLRQADSLLRSTLDRLAYWDIDEQHIVELEQTREVRRHVTVTAPVDGVVAEVMSEALEGMFVKPGMDLYKLADLSSVWVHADIYELDIPWIRDGQPAEVSFRNAPDERFRGKVLFLYPEVSRDTRTLKICVEVPNPQERLRPGMYADVIVQGPTVKQAVAIPQSAVIRSGERNIVFVALGEGRFEPREVTLGVKGDRDLIEVTAGVDEGERVVTQSQFMLDSESRIQEAIAKFRARSGSAP